MADLIPAFRGYGALRIGRWSQSNSDYFVTVCLARPLSGLTHAAIAPVVRDRLHELEARGSWTLRTYVLMPDHLHVLFTLAPNADVSSALRSFKGPLTPFLRAQGLRWQKNFYDHRLRTVDELLPTFLYIFLNPYRAGLMGPKEKWPWYFSAPEDWEWFGGLTNEAMPAPEWLQ